MLLPAPVLVTFKLTPSSASSTASAATLLFPTGPCFAAASSGARSQRAQLQRSEADSERGRCTGKRGDWAACMQSSAQTMGYINAIDAVDNIKKAGLSRQLEAAPCRGARMACVMPGNSYYPKLVSELEKKTSAHSRGTSSRTDRNQWELRR